MSDAQTDKKCEHFPECGCASDYWAPDCWPVKATPSSTAKPLEGATPRTDAEHKRLLDLDYGDDGDKVNHWEVAFLLLLEFARQLERELAEANAARATLHDTCREYETRLQASPSASGKPTSEEVKMAHFAIDAGMPELDIQNWMQHARVLARAVLRFSTPAESSARATIPLGFALVPNDPTPEMVKALNSFAVCAGYIEKGYRAMLKAAPKPTLYDELQQMNKVLAVSTPAEGGKPAWQPMETAPKDGSKFLIVCATDTDPEIEVCDWYEIEDWHWERLSEDTYRKVVTEKRGSWNSNGHRATHWMPLPDAPSGPNCT